MATGDEMDDDESVNIVYISGRSRFSHQVGGLVHTPFANVKFRPITCTHTYRIEGGQRAWFEVDVLNVLLNFF